jgi:hypothetical protein
MSVAEELLSAMILSSLRKTPGSGGRSVAFSTRLIISSLKPIRSPRDTDLIINIELSLDAANIDANFTQLPCSIATKKIEIQKNMLPFPQLLAILAVNE